MVVLLHIIKNTLVALLAVGFLGAVIYFGLVLLERMMRHKLRGREQQGLTQLWITTQDRRDPQRDTSAANPDNSTTTTVSDDRI